MIFSSVRNSRYSHDQASHPWAENTFIDDALEPPADNDMLNDILAYLAAADTAQFPLTWDVCAGFLENLGVMVQVITTD